MIGFGWSERYGNKDTTDPRRFNKSHRRHRCNHKRVKESQPVYSVRIGLGYRALGLLKGDTVTWFWIGTHDEYDQLLR